MFARVLLVLMLLPAIEIAVLVWLALETSVWFVLALLLGAGLLGTFLARQQGLRAMTRVADEVRRGRMPADALLDALLVSLAAVLLILPGLLSDVVAILLLFPPTRHLLKRSAKRGIQARVVTTTYQAYDAPQGHDEVIDVRVIDSSASKS